MATPVLIQVATDTRDNTSDTLNPSWGSATTTGNLLVAVMAVRTPGAGTVPSAFTPPAGVGWTSAVGQTVDLGSGGMRARVEIFYIENASSQSGATGSWTYTGGVYMSGSTNATIQLLEYSGVSTSGALDKTASAVAAGNGGSFPYTDATSVSSGTTATTAQANELLIAGLYVSNYAPGSPSNSFTSQSSINSGGAAFTMVADRIVTATGTYETSATYSTASANAGVIATFKYTASAANTSNMFLFF